MNLDYYLTTIVLVIGVDIIRINNKYHCEDDYDNNNGCSDVHCLCVEGSMNRKLKN